MSADGFLHRIRKRQQPCAHSDCCFWIRSFFKCHRGWFVDEAAARNGQPSLCGKLQYKGAKCYLSPINVTYKQPIAYPILAKVSSYIFAAAQYSSNKRTTGASVWQPAQKTGGSCKKEGLSRRNILLSILYISSFSHTRNFFSGGHSEKVWEVCPGKQKGRRWVPTLFSCSSFSLSHVSCFLFLCECVFRRSDARTVVLIEVELQGLVDYSRFQ